MGEDAFLEAQYEDRFMLPDENEEGTYMEVCDTCELLYEDCECEQEAEGPAPEDYMLTPSGHLGGLTAVYQVEGGWVRDFDTTEEALAFIEKRMTAEHFWPSLWWQSDHGNVWPINTNGEEIK